MQKNDVDIICLPELIMKEKWINLFKKSANKMVIVGGSYYKNCYNICPLLIDGKKCRFSQKKINPSSNEDPDIVGKGMVSGKIINIYDTKYGKFSTLICRDIEKFIPFLRGLTDFVFVPSFNPIPDRFFKEADIHVSNSPSYVLISNTALYGGSAIFGQIDKKYLKSLKRINCRKNKDRYEYKICELKKNIEGMIIADLDIFHKSPTHPTPGDSSQEIKNIKIIKKIFFRKRK